MNRLEALSNAFAEYFTFPISCYCTGSPLKVFQELYPNNYYTNQVNHFLQYHQYKPIHRGSDMPWWGSKYFSDEKGLRTFIISQDSLAKDAGSVAFWANLFGVVKTKVEYDNYTSRLNEKQLFRFSSWRKVHEQLLEWGLNLDCCYITDAAKVYKSGSWQDRDFNKVKSKELLMREIFICNPDLIITLGSTPLLLINKEWNYGELVENGDYILVNAINTVVSPFIIGNGPTQTNFKKRLEIVASLIKQKQVTK